MCSLESVIVSHLNQWGTAERHWEMCNVCSHLCLDVIHHPAVLKKWSHQKKKNILFNNYIETFFKIRSKKKWLLSPEKCYSGDWNSPRLRTGRAIHSTVLITFLCLAQWKWHQGQILKEKGFQVLYFSEIQFIRSHFINRPLKLS